MISQILKFPRIRLTAMKVMRISFRPRLQALVLEYGENRNYRQHQIYTFFGVRDFKETE
jgi:hypothetical protein